MYQWTNKDKGNKFTPLADAMVQSQDGKRKNLTISKCLQEIFSTQSFQV